MLIRNGGQIDRGGGAVYLGLARVATSSTAPLAPALTPLFLTVQKIGSVLYGSAYMLLAFLRNDFVARLGWFTNQQLLDAVAVGQFTPRPVFTAATFVGSLVAEWPGAVLATVGIFLPPFLFVAAVNPLIPHLRRSPWAGTLLDGVNPITLGLMAAVTWQLSRSAITDWLTGLLSVSAAAMLVRLKVNSTWLVLGGGCIGLAVRWLGP